jgi:hypothetical protein
MGWAEKSWMARCRPCQAEIEGSRKKGRKWFRVNSACVREEKIPAIGGERNVGGGKGG